MLRRGKDAWPFYVRATLPPGLAAAERRDATLALVREGADTPPAYASSPRPGASWPWLLGFLALAGLVWWFERARFGRGPSL